jgi:hypothetical protein
MQESSIDIPPFADCLSLTRRNPDLYCHQFSISARIRRKAGWPALLLKQAATCTPSELRTVWNSRVAVGPLRRQQHTALFELVDCVPKPSATVPRTGASCTTAAVYTYALHTVAEPHMLQNRGCKALLDDRCGKRGGSRSGYRTSQCPHTQSYPAPSWLFSLILSFCSKMGRHLCIGRTASG